MPRSISCTQCNQTFTRTTTLRRHVRNTHSAETQRLLCADCTQTFSRRDLLDRHSKSHSGLGAKACGICSRSFRSDYLLWHTTSCASKTKSRWARIQAAEGSSEHSGTPKQHYRVEKLRQVRASSPSHHDVQTPQQTAASSTLRVVPSVYSSLLQGRATNPTKTPISSMSSCAV